MLAEQAFMISAEYVELKQWLNLCDMFALMLSLHCIGEFNV